MLAARVLSASASESRNLSGDGQRRLVILLPLNSKRFTLQALLPFGCRSLRMTLINVFKPSCGVQGDCLNDGRPRTADPRETLHSAVCGPGPKVIPRGCPPSPRTWRHRSQLELFMRVYIAACVSVHALTKSLEGPEISGSIAVVQHSSGVGGQTLLNLPTHIYKSGFISPS
jgi:hypothetical protein